MRSGPVFRRAFAVRQRALHKHLTAALGGDEQAVHQARVATRRLREALPVLGAGLGRKRVRRLRRRLRKMTRLFGAVRERDVALKMLDARQTDGSVGTTAADRVRASLNDGRDAARSRMVDALDAQKVSRWLEDVKAFEHELQSPHADAGWTVVLARRLLQGTDRLRRAVDDAGLLFVSERLHAVRVALKRLRYAVELAGELGGRKLDATLKELKACQDTLGELHDIDMLMIHVGTRFDAETDPHVRAALETLQSKLEADRHGLHARYLTQRPSLLVLIDRIQDQVVPRFQMVRAGARATRLGRQLPQNLRREEPAERAGAGLRR